MNERKGTGFEGNERDISLLTEVGEDKLHD